MFEEGSNKEIITNLLLKKTSVTRDEIISACANPVMAVLLNDRDRAKKAKSTLRYTIARIKERLPENYDIVFNRRTDSYRIKIEEK